MNISPAPRRPPKGVALVVVLAFVVLLTGLIVAYFSQSMTGRQLSNNSAGQMRAAMMAQSATDTIIAGFKQEIKTGSTSATVGTGTSQSTIYVPTANANAVPVRYPTPAPGANPADPIPNLVRESRRGDTSNGALVSPAVPSYASALNSSSDATQDGRTVTATRWNSHFLIPSQSTATTTDSTPDTTVNFTAPDWVLVTRNGPAVHTAVGSGPGALNDATPSNGNFVIGRYAYAVYDEGGLLDMNVAGHPTPAATSAQTGFTPTQLSRKGSLAMADLTQLPVVKNPNTASTSDYLAQAMVDRIVGWRNYASAGLSSSYPNFTFTSTQASDWFKNFATNNTSRFLKAYGGGATNLGATDQAFLSRQQLLKLRASLGFGANALQYMGTFSRGLEQPSYVPAHIQYPSAAPSINAVASTTPPAASSVSTYVGNNDAAGNNGTTAGQDIINPSLLTVRVQNAFTRTDLLKTPAVVGEPLLKKKFPLNRLAEITYSATDASPSIVDPAATTNHIKDWFGLSRSSTASPWTYSQGVIDSSGRVSIMTLDKVAQANREPNLAELLKGAINAGSLAKAGPNLKDNEGNFQYTLDVALDYQVLQIMANLIDQSDTDSYPTVIQIAAGSIMRTFRGTEDLPYFYRYHPFSVVTELPDPLLSKSTTVAFTVPDAGAPTRSVQSCEPRPATGLVKAGKVVGLYIPEVWNPHDASNRVTANANRPARFRLTVITTDPALPTPQTPMWLTGIKPQTSSDWYNDVPPKASIPQLTRGLTDPGTATTDSTAFTFSDDGGKLFREPTLLWHADSPANINLAAESGSVAGPYTDVNSADGMGGGVYYGVRYGQSPISYEGTVSGSTYPASPQAADDKYIFQATSISTIYSQPPLSYINYTFRLQYQDPNNSLNWITYDEKYPDIHGLYSPRIIVNKADYPRSQWANPLPNRTNQLSDSATGYDPRTARFGVGTASEFNDGMMVVDPKAVANYNNDTDTGNLAMTSSKFTVIVSQRPYGGMGSKVKYSCPGMASDANGGRNLEQRWFSGRGWNASANATGAGTWPLMWDGVLFGQNNPAIKLPQRSSSSTYDGSNYYEDPDGVARRAMGAYAHLATNGVLPGNGSTANLEGLPLAMANTFTNDTGVGTPTAQSLSRPLILNRPLRSVGEMSYTFRGTPWKQLDFFTPESGDAALLDVFCVNETPADGIVAGKVNLNTHQSAVLQAVAAGTARDELSNVSNPPPAYALKQALTNDEAGKVAAKLVGITTDTTHAWRGPLTNIADLVGRFVNTTPGNSTGETDFYTFNETVTGKNYTYAGLSAALDTTVYTTASNQTARIQRMRESAIRALSDSGQTRVWNLLIDVVAQTGRYAPNATTLSQFAVEGESRCWVHVAIDRATGEVIDRQIEIVSE